MSDPNYDMTMLNGRTEPDRMRLLVGGGEAVAYSVRAPNKTTENEDTVAIIPYGPDAAVLVVADGVGGLPGGKRASETAVRMLEASLQEAMHETMLLRTAIMNGIESANEAVRNIGNGSATTMTVVTVEGRTARTYQMGDSEAIVVGQRGRIRSQTMAHSPTGFAVEAGFLDYRDALHHEDRHLLSNFLGTNDMRIEVGGLVELQPMDTILLASDGLTDNIHADEIVEFVRKGPLDKAMDDLTRCAVRRMTVESKTLPSKPDDLSVILFRKPPRHGARARGGE
ncbi:MAG: serine/threonine-protein phosphatase [Gammaproteobacteria bacterium]|nr:serine/threonine-protein phosphatase [Gammaproteobacteria bacterium]MDH4255093.1 serine/threonine-protein phosphatase [Gammaproteobacteria bacterium]MDH5311189.1 serine/threonine-protein phosphatase [Gammaproteobacteria bacterium]